jgi:hypothetical protein
MRASGKLRGQAGTAVGSAGALALLVSLHLPWYDVSRPPGLGPGTVTGTQALTGTGIAIAAAALAGLAASLAQGRRGAAVQLAAGLLAAALVGHKLTSLPYVPPESFPAGVPLYVRAEAARWGAYVALASALLLAASGGLGLRAGRPAAAWAARAAELRTAWTIAWTTRALVLVTGVLGALSYGPAGPLSALQRPFGEPGNLLVAPTASWDAGIYLHVAEHGYTSDYFTVGFPLYPLTIRGLSFVIDSPLVAGVAISVLALVAALHLLGRLVALELGERYARPAMLVLALFPMSFFLSAVYTESLFLALSIGCLYAARRHRWAWAGALGGLAAATRNTGVLLALPLAILWWEGDRDRRGLLAVGLVPLGLLAYLAYMGTWGEGDPLRPFHATHTFWNRDFEVLGGVWDGVGAVLDVRRLDAGAMHNLVDLGFLAYALVAAAGAVRRLPRAWWAYALASLVVVLSAPYDGEPLASLPRYVMAIFPLQVWLAVWAVDRDRLQPVLIGSAALLGVFSAEFAALRWVA